MTQVVIGADHRGYALKEDLKIYLKTEGYAVKDVGARVLVVDDDYPDYAIKVAQQVAEHAYAKGIIICGSGIGVTMAANKVPGVRAASCMNKEMARTAREHEDANVCTLASDTTEPNAAREIVDTFLFTPFSKGERHVRRLEKIKKIEKKYDHHTSSHS